MVTHRRLVGVNLGFIPQMRSFEHVLDSIHAEPIHPLLQPEMDYVLLEGSSILIKAHVLAMAQTPRNILTQKIHFFQ